MIQREFFSSDIFTRVGTQSVFLDKTEMVGLACSFLGEVPIVVLHGQTNEVLSSEYLLESKKGL